jgi:hypothetical protein
MMDDADVEAAADVVGILIESMCTPSVLTIRLQKGNALLGGRFLATVTCVKRVGRD